jgi:hypothetical protein
MTPDNFWLVVTKPIMHIYLVSKGGTAWKGNIQPVISKESVHK